MAQTESDGLDFLFAVGDRFQAALWLHSSLWSHDVPCNITCLQDSVRLPKVVIPDRIAEVLGVAPISFPHS